MAESGNCSRIFPEDPLFGQAVVIIVCADAALVCVGLDVVGCWASVLLKMR